LATLFAFLPFFNHMSIPMQVKAAMAFYFTIVLYPIVPVVPEPATTWQYYGAVLSEVMVGLLAGLALQIVFGILDYAGEIIAYVMGFSLASAIDPQTQMQRPLVAQFISTMGLMIMLAFNGHHLLLWWVAELLQRSQLGGFVTHPDMLDYLLHAFANLFVIGFSIAFPIVALALLSDIIFGMLMKTMPQFNLLVVGFPIKIALSFGVWIVVLGAMMLIFKRQFLDAVATLFQWLP
jgi:flagellar biosynthetic protein FliR